MSLLQFLIFIMGSWNSLRYILKSLLLDCPQTSHYCCSLGHCSTSVDRCQMHQCFCILHASLFCDLSLKPRPHISGTVLRVYRCVAVWPRLDPNEFKLCPTIPPLGLANVFLRQNNESLQQFSLHGFATRKASHPPFPALEPSESPCMLSFFTH